MIKVNRVAILGLKRIGDAVYTLPLFEAIKKQYPQAVVDVLTEPQVKDIYINNLYIDNLYVFKKKNFWRSALDVLKNNQYDACIVLHNAFKYALIPFLARVPIRVGYIKEARGWLLTHKIDLPEQVIHRLEHNARLGDLIKVESRGILPRIYLSSDDKQAAIDLLEANQLHAKSYIVFIVGSISPTRRWFPENFAKVADLISSQLELDVLILGGPDDTDIADKVVAACSTETSVHNLTGKTSLRQTLALFEQSAAVVTNDTGPLHAASAIGVPVVTWFGAANEKEIAPPSPHTTILNAHVHCSPCVKEVCAYNLECLREIKPAMVFDQLTREIKK